jgi:hypothetical protein
MPSNVTNAEDVEEEVFLRGDHWGHAFKVLTTMGRYGHLGMNQTPLPPGRAAGPFHYHQREEPPTRLGSL